MEDQVYKDAMQLGDKGQWHLVIIAEPSFRRMVCSAGTLKVPTNDFTVDTRRLTPANGQAILYSVNI